MYMHAHIYVYVCVYMHMYIDGNGWLIFNAYRKINKDFDHKKTKQKKHP